MPRFLLLFAIVAGMLPAQIPEAAPAAGEIPVFRSDVVLVRVDVQVLDRDRRAIPHLQAEDFVLREEGRVIPIHNFASEQAPVDILLLLDVSGSMRPHVERIARATEEAFRVLTEQDRVGIMVFDRATRLRSDFRSSREETSRDFDRLLRQESFDGGTDITLALKHAAAYMQRHARPQARRAIVILTDDQTEFDRDEAGVGNALARSDTVLSALIAPNMMPHMSGGGGRRTGGWGGPLGGVIFGGPFPGGGGRYPGGGGRYPGGGGRYPGGGGGYPGGGGGAPGGGGRFPGGSRSRSAGTEAIAQASGGDSLRVDDASALEITFSRIRQRYTLHFHVPAGAREGQERNISIALASAADRRYTGAELRYRHTYFSPSGGVAGEDPDVAVISGSAPARQPAEDTETLETRPPLRRRPAGDGMGGNRGPNPELSSTPPQASSNNPAPATASGGWRRATEAEQKKVEAPAEASPEPASRRGGWRRVTDPEPPQPTAKPLR